MRKIKKLVGKVINFVRDLEDEGFFDGDSPENTKGLYKTHNQKIA